MISKIESLRLPLTSCSTTFFQMPPCLHSLSLRVLGVSVAMDRIVQALMRKVGCFDLMKTIYHTIG